MLVPKLVTTLKDYSRAQFVTDLGAGVILGIVALPLAIAFGIASGVTPKAGLVTAIVAGLVISALGGSRVQIGGPTGAFVVIVYGVVERYGVEGLTIATLMAGVILVALGLARLGGAIKFIPFPVTTGFTAAIAVVIFSGQVKDLLGLERERRRPSSSRNDGATSRTSTRSTCGRSAWPRWRSRSSSSSPRSIAGFRRPSWRWS